MKNLTKYLLLAGLLLTFSLTAFAQKPGTPDYLLVKNGFKIFKLGDPVEKHKEHVVLVSDNKRSGDKLYKVLLYTDLTFTSIGDSIIINAIFLTVNDGLITAISVFVKDEYKEPFLRTLQAAYGNGRKGALHIGDYTWDAHNNKYDIGLTYKDNYKEDGYLDGNGWAIFHDYNLLGKQLKGSKNKSNNRIDDL